jgi:hypothetical protein
MRREMQMYCSIFQSIDLYLMRDFRNILEIFRTEI